MFRSLDFYRGLVIGLGVMYIVDPVQGKTRRVRIRDRVGRAFRESGDFLGKGSRDLRHRAAGTVAKTVSRILPDGADDATLAERVRAKLGRYASHPHAIGVEARDGRVTLRGPILRREVEELIGAISSVRGVVEVVNRLEPHDMANGIPSLQGRGRRAGERAAWMPAEWSPGTQLAAGLLGAAVLAIGAQRIAARVRSRYDYEHDVKEMPEYAMLR